MSERTGLASIAIGGDKFKAMTATATIHVGNLPFTATAEQLRALFAPHGDVLSVNLINDRETGRPSGFGFVSMPETAAPKAIAAINGYTLEGRALRVNPAQERHRHGGGPFRR